MNFFDAITQDETMVISETPEGLEAIHKHNCAAVIWQRQPLPSFQYWIDSLDPTQLPKTRMLLPKDTVHAAVTQVCDLCGTPECYERSLLVDDIAANAHIFSDLMAASYIMLRLDVLTNNAYPNFHVDAVTARLLCTYRGTGTQYGISTNGAPPIKVITAPTGAPVLMRGTLWPERLKPNLLHRSPPIEGTGETRLLLSLDPVFEPDNHKNHHVLH